MIFIIYFLNFVIDYTVQNIFYTIQNFFFIQFNFIYIFRRSINEYLIYIKYIINKIFKIFFFNQKWNFIRFIFYLFDIQWFDIIYYSILVIHHFYSVLIIVNFKNCIFPIYSIFAYFQKKIKIQFFILFIRYLTI